MIRSLPVDTTRLNLVASCAPVPKAEWAQLSDGSRRPSGNQAKDEDGYPLWIVDCLAIGLERPEVIAVEVAGDQPEVQVMQPVAFEGLVVQLNVSKKTGGLGTYWSADRVVTARRASVSASSASSGS